MIIVQYFVEFIIIQISPSPNLFFSLPPFPNSKESRKKERNLNWVKKRRKRIKGREEGTGKEETIGHDFV